MQFDYAAFHSDNGPPCAKCGGTIYQYSPSMHRTGIMLTLCLTCNADDYFVIDERGSDVTSPMLSRRHRVARGFKVQS